MAYEKIIKKGNYIWKGSDIKVVFSKPSIQAYDDFGSIDTEDDILYFYYNISIFAKNKNKKHGKKWTPIVSYNVSDFPEIFTIRDVIKRILNNEIPENEYQKSPCYFHGEVLEDAYYMEYHCSLFCGFFIEDAYDITHTIMYDDDKKHEWFDLSVGASPVYGSRTAITATASRISREELCQFYETIKEFVEDAIYLHNIRTRERNADFANSLYSRGKFLYAGNDMLFPNYKNMDTITVLESGSTETCFHSITYNNFKILRILDDEIQIVAKSVKTERSGNCKPTDGKPITIKFSDIVYMWKGIDDIVTSYNEEQIASNFLSVMDECIKDDFIRMREDTLYTLYHNILINFYVMNREEHEFKEFFEKTHRKKYADEATEEIFKGNHRKIVNEAVRSVIHMIKEKVES